MSVMQMRKLRRASPGSKLLRLPRACSSCAQHLAQVRTDALRMGRGLHALRGAREQPVVEMRAQLVEHGAGRRLRHVRAGRPPSRRCRSCRPRRRPRAIRDRAWPWHSSGGRHHYRKSQIPGIAWRLEQIVVAANNAPMTPRPETSHMTTAPASRAQPTPPSAAPTTSASARCTSRPCGNSCMRWCRASRRRPACRRSGATTRSARC